MQRSVKTQRNPKQRKNTTPRNTKKKIEYNTTQYKKKK